jgi:hypothetical protein
VLGILERAGRQTHGRGNHIAGSHRRQSSETEIMTDKNTPDLYQVLGVPPMANDTELDNAFRTLARRLYTDGGDDEFQEMLSAYAVLRDPIARKKYDRGRTISCLQQV